MALPSCDFTYAHYADILEVARARGYRFSTFTEPPDETLRLYLRHDIDVSLQNALRLAQLEHEAGVVSTFFVMPTAPYYNLLEDTTLGILRQVHGLGHHIGLHVDERASLFGEGSKREEALRWLFDAIGRVIVLEPVISFHIPRPAVMNEPMPPYVSVYAPEFFSGIKYISDSGRRWREGCLCQWISHEPPPSLQVLTHPLWWNDDERDLRQVYQLLRDRGVKATKSFLTDIAGFKALDEAGQWPD